MYTCRKQVFHSPSQITIAKPPFTDSWVNLSFIWSRTALLFAQLDHGMVSYTLFLYAMTSLTSWSLTCQCQMLPLYQSNSSAYLEQYSVWGSCFYSIFLSLNVKPGYMHDLFSALLLDCHTVHNVYFEIHVWIRVSWIARDKESPNICCCTGTGKIMCRWSVQWGIWAIAFLRQVCHFC
jgi:hypothetical protein